MAAVPQKHKIMRQVLELRGCREHEAQRAQSELREAYYRRLVPLIDKVCSELGAPHRIDRIDTLEIDLGAVPLDALESAVAGKFEAAFAEKLAAAIGDAPELDADLELFDLFIRTGTLPWWADLSDRRVLEASLERLVARAPQALRRALRAAPDPERTLRRVALAYPDSLLAALAGALAPALHVPERVLEDLAGALASPRTARNFWWEEFLLHALRAGDAPLAAAQAGAEPFFRTVLARVAHRLGIEYRALIEALRRALDAGPSPMQSRAHGMVEGLSREVEREAETMKTLQGAPPELEQTMARLEALLASHAGLLARLRDIRRLPLYLQAQAAAALEAAVFEAGILDAAQTAAARERQAVPERETLRETEARLEKEARLEEQALREKARPDSRFSDADQIYVENSGLVILWPFLERFFNNVGLLEEKAFRDEAGRQRAAGLLHYLATGEAPQAEHLLPLNKVLCGIPLEEVFEFGEPMTEAETEACDELLGAVIGHAPILREMSIPGFRASFLLRKGQLSARDGAWLLRVERETHDVVLDRFPWSVNLVKLPWMEAMMQVEW